MKVLNETSIPFDDQFLLDPVDDGASFVVNVTTTPATAGIEIRGHALGGGVYEKKVTGQEDGIELPLLRRELYVRRLPGLTMYRISQGEEDRPLVKV